MTKYVTSDQKRPATKHAALYASFTLVPFAVGVIIAIGILLFVLADHGWWWAFWALIVAEVYVIFAVVSVRRGAAAKRRKSRG